ncbi:hypothetical protein CRUP_003203, partial [Coryphaenoides rupestris]
MELETIAEPPAGTPPSRHEKSLGLLTIKFVNLLQEAKDGVLDLKVVSCRQLGCETEEEDIMTSTNVLEGVGLIEKKTKNIIQWRGENMGSQSEEVLEQVEILKAQISGLEAQERELDDRKAWLDQSIKHLCHDPVTSAYPSEASSGQKRYQVTLRSQTAPIQVLLINRETPSSRPVVFSVPPGDDTSVLPTPPSTPASLQRFPLSSSYISSSYSSGCSQDSLCADHHQMALQDNALTPSSTPPVQM